MEDFNTYFFDKNGVRIGSLIGLIPVTPGMELQVKGYKGLFTVEKYFLRIDHPDRDPGFHVFCREEASAD